MATGKRYYWIKLKDSFFADDGPVDFLMSQEGGANYVVLYELLCLKAINTSGRLSNKIGEVLIPYDIEKIRRTCKYFSVDTIRIALKLYRALGLIYEDRNGVLVISDYKKLVGSETDWAEKKQRQRLKGKTNSQKALPDGTSGDADGDTDGDADGDIDGDTDGDNVPIDIKRSRYKEIKSLENKKSVSQTTVRADAHEDGQTDDELQTILDECELEFFEPSMREIFTDAIERLYYTEGLRVGKSLLPQERVRSRLHQLNFLILQEVQQKIEANKTKIKNPTSYIMNVIYTTITEYESSVIVAPELHEAKQVE